MKDAKEYILGKGDHWSESIDVMKTIYKGLGEIRSAITENTLSSQLINSEAEVEEAGNRLANAQVIVPGLEGQVTNAKNRAEKENADIRTSINKAIGRMVDKLEEEVKNGGWSGFLAQIFLMLMGSNMPSSIPMPKPQ